LVGFISAVGREAASIGRFELRMVNSGRRQLFQAIENLPEPPERLGILLAVQNELLTDGNSVEVDPVSCSVPTPNVGVA